ncbi:LysR substrate-binding domain-containing protein [Devosia sp.]|uniref:LysR substrate-binding domain-containing protein n=1 Tax=Devosia sp. TaxID=1871048 RepID=UPI00260D26AC|nr:LysR substrate-binding domain-containing protein [Devosia sp.]
MFGGCEPDCAGGFPSQGPDRIHSAGDILERRTQCPKQGFACLRNRLPVLPKFLGEYPDVRIEMIVDDSFIDIVADKIDAGIRFGDIVEKDMIAVRIGPDVPLCVVGSPSYFEKFGYPQNPRELSSHRCINYRHLRTSGFFGWEFVEDGRPLQARVEGPLVFSNTELLLDAALAGHGLAYTYENYALEHIKAGRLERTLAQWCPTFPGYYLYHPSRRQVPPALTALIAALKYRA